MHTTQDTGGWSLTQPTSGRPPEAPGPAGGSRSSTDTTASTDHRIRPAITVHGPCEQRFAAHYGAAWMRYRAAQCRRPKAAAAKVRSGAAA